LPALSTAVVIEPVAVAKAVIEELERRGYKLTAVKV
jgi:hypothetical protein